MSGIGVIVVALVLALAPACSAATEARMNYGPVADGPVPTVVDTGQPLVIFEPHFPAEIKNGVLTDSYTGAPPAAAYFGVGLDAPVKSMGMTFAFKGVPSQKSAVGIIPWTSAFDSFPPAPRSSPAHLTITPVSWGLQIWEKGAFRPLRSEYFGHLLTAGEVVAKGKNLPTDGSTLEAEWRITGDTITIDLPNGVSRVLSDPAIEDIEAHWPTPEIFYDTGVGAPRVEIRSWWANTPMAGNPVLDGVQHPPAAIDAPASTSTPVDGATQNCQPEQVQRVRAAANLRNARRLNRSANSPRGHRKARHRVAVSKSSLQQATQRLALCRT